ncbi:hypothetical protein BD626DRAFT_563776 [Schizophyllum amplum]|uniref:DUF6533 domain-containing protein n=1 Tax=Schizophyllum amplum TaxID=97359 RepID=A0A550CZ80_9AGAR|nr:hypothetical protein BD626DRAFT_563776 [Auriculariopsis ampla]
MSLLGGYNVQSAISYAAGIILLCEHLDTVTFEARWIWRNLPRWESFNAIKLVYLCARYFGIASQILSIVVVTRIYRVDGPSIYGCSMWIWIQFAGQYVLWTCLEALLMLRVYALYSRSSFMGYFLSAFLVFEAVIAGYITFSRTSQSYQLPVPSYLFAIDEGACLHDVSTGIPYQVIYFGVVQISAQILILGLTLARCIPALRVHHSLNRLLYRLIKDGFISFVVIMGLIFTPLSAYFTGKATILYSQPIANAVVALTTCRLIIRIQTMDSQDDSEEERQPSGVELTSAVSSNFEETGTDWGSMYNAAPSSSNHAGPSTPGGREQRAGHERRVAWAS